MDTVLLCGVLWKAFREDYIGHQIISQILFSSSSAKKDIKKKKKTKPQENTKIAHVSYSNSSPPFSLTYCASANRRVAVKYIVVNCLLWSLWLLLISSVNLRRFIVSRRELLLPGGWEGLFLWPLLLGFPTGLVGEEQAELFCVVSAVTEVQTERLCSLMAADQRSAVDPKRIRSFSLG